MSAPENIQSIQPQNKLIDVIVHDLIKKDGVLAIDERNSQLAVNRTVQRLVDQLVSEYAKRPGKSHGQFEDDEDNYPVQRFVRQYFVTHEQTFLELSMSLMKALHKAAHSTATTGGHVFIAHMTRDDIDYLLVAILTDELGAALTEGKDVEDSIYLDIKGFRLAGRVDMTCWSSDGERYLSFLKGRGQDRVSDYFKEFLGCNNSVAAAAETNTLISGLELFSTQKKMTEVDKSAFVITAHAICTRLAKDETPFELQTFANELWPDDPSQLIAVLSDPNLKLSDGFVPDRRALRKMVTFSGKTADWSLNFKRAAISNKHILLNADQTLTITNPPAELLARLQKELVEDKDDEA